MRSDAMKSGIFGLAVAGAVASMQAQAVGLGAIEVRSKLDQPFVAEIPLTLNDPSEAGDLVVRLASPEAFARVGMDPNQLSANLQFSVGKNARGESVVRVTTPQRMNDPYVTFLLEADWGKGKMVREYTALLDPPHTASVPKRAISAPMVASTPLPAPSPSVMQPVATPSVATAPMPPVPAPVEPAPPERSMPIAQAEQPESPSPDSIAPQPEPPPMPAATAPEPAPIAEAPPPPAPAPIAEASPPPQMPEPAPAPEAPKAASNAVTVGQGQTLSAIADQVRPSDVSVNRMMIALQRANPNAFIKDNINLLKRGVVLRIPDSGQAQTVTAAEANALVHEQVESWRQGQQPTPTLQPEDTAITTTAAAKKFGEFSAIAVDPASAEKAKAASAAANASNKAATGTQIDTTASVPKSSRPRGAHLEIVPPAGSAAANSQSGASEGGSGSELRAQLAQTKEELTARSAEVSDLKSKVSDLEKMQNDSTQLLSMKDSQLAALQQKLGDLEKQQSAATPAQSSAASAPIDVAPIASTAPTAIPASNASTSDAAPGTDPATAPQLAPASKTPLSQANEPVAEMTPWYLQPFVLIGGALLVLAGLLGLMLRRPRAPEPAPRSRFDTGALAASMAASRAAQQPDAHDDALHNDALVEAMPASELASAIVTEEHAAVPKPAVIETVLAGTPAPIVADEEDYWAIPSEVTLSPEPVVTTTNETAVRPAVRIGDANPTVATKLELARAYIDIGDHDGARSMLEEVLIEGNATQQEAAFELLDKLDG